RLSWASTCKPTSSIRHGRSPAASRSTRCCRNCRKRVVPASTDESEGTSTPAPTPRSEISWHSVAELSWIGRSFRKSGRCRLRIARGGRPLEARLRREEGGALVERQGLSERSLRLQPAHGSDGEDGSGIP